MKKTEHILAYTGLVLFTLGVLFKSMHWPGAGVSINFAVLIIGLGYLPLQLIREQRANKSTLKLIYLIFRFITLFLILFAFLFKVQHWPGAGLLYFFATFLLPAYILFYLYVAYKGLTGRPLNVDTVVMIAVGFSIYFFTTRSNVSPTIVNGYLVLEKQFRKTNAGLQSANSIIYESLEAIQNNNEPDLMASIGELQEISDSLSQLSTSIQKEFLSLFALDSDQKELWKYGLRLMSGNDLSEEFFMVKGKASELRTMLELYETRVKKIQARHQIPAGMIGVGFDLQDHITEWGDTLTWEMQMFGRKPVAACFTNLRWIEQVALINENVLLKDLVNQFDLSEESYLIRELANKESQQAIELKENEILRINQQTELQNIQLETTRTELRQRNILLVVAIAGIAFVLVLLLISSRAFYRKQKDMQVLEKQKKEIEGQRDEIGTQRDEIEGQRDEIEAQRDEIEAQRDLVQEQKEQIEKTHHEVSSSIDYAMRLQDAMLPGPALLEEHFSGHLIFFRPKQKVSGDFYWWTRSGDSVIIAVADCTGHGVPGAFMSLLGASLLKEIVSREGITRPGLILDRMREEVINALNQKGAMGEQKDGMDMSLVTINPSTLLCQYAGANNPLYLLRRGQLHIHRPDLMPISHYEEMNPFTTTEVQLEASDQLYLFSDGYADQFGSSQRKKFKYSSFRQVITEHADLSMPRQQQVLSDTIREWQGNYEQTDDMVILGIRI